MMNRYRVFYESLFIVFEKRIILLCLISLLTRVGLVQGGELKGDKARLNYSVGYQVGSDFKYQKIEVREEVLLKGIEDALAGVEPLMSKAEMQQSMADLGKRVMEIHQKEKAQALSRLIEKEHEFLQENAGKPGVKTTPSGLQYLVLEEGQGRSPGPKDNVTVNYRGRLIDGTEFDSSYKRGKPATIRLDQVVPGWTEALQLMKVGAKWRLFIPAKLAYGDQGQLANRTLIFDVELLSVD